MKAIRLRRSGSFAGGIDLPDEKHETLHAPITPVPKPSRLLLPLKPCGRTVARCVVQAGQRVQAHQCLAKATDETGIDIHAPLAGKVGQVRSVQVADRDGFVPQPALELTDLEDPALPEPTGQEFDLKQVSPETLREEMQSGGLTTFGRRTQPLHLWLQRARQGRCQVLICNGMENQPYVTAEHAMLRHYGPEVIRGLAILEKALEARSSLIAVDNRRTDDYRGLIEPTRSHDIARISLHNKYPIGADNLLVKVLTGREVPPGASPLSLHVAVVAPPTCLAVYRWIAGRKPSTHRVVTVAGENAASPGNYWAPFGMDCLELAATSQHPVVHGGPMFGTRLAGQAVLSPSTDALLVLQAPEFPLPSPCVRCGWCTDHCPARLNVAALNDAFELGDIAFADRAGALACVECGLCSYVCPARLPLSQRIRRLKRNLFQLRHRAGASAKGAK